MSARRGEWVINQPRATSSPVRHVLLLLLASAGLWLWNYGLWDLEGPDEGRYVQIAKELLSGSNWLVLTVNGEPYAEKPPLAFWMIAASLKLFGGEVSAWSARLPSVLAGIFTVLLVFDIGRVRWNVRAGFAAGLILLSVPLFALQTPTARLDILFTAWITLSAWAWLTSPAENRTSRLTPRRAVLFWVALAGAFFTKGPLALVVLFGMLLGESWRSHSWRPWRSVYPLPGLAALALLIVGWFAAQSSAVGGELVRREIAVGAWQRFMNGDHVEPVWYYVKTVLGEGFMPWLFFLVPALIFLWRRRGEGLPEGIRPLLCWLAAVLIVLHLSPGKRSYYLLPAIPAMALITAWFIDRHFLDRPLSLRLKLLFGTLGVALSMALPGAAVVFEVFEDRLQAELFIVGYMQYAFMVAILLIMIAAAVSFLRRRTAWRAVAMLAVLVLSLEMFYASVVNTARNTRRSTRPFASVVNALMKADETRVGAVGRADNPEYHVYGRYRVLPIELEGGEPASLDILPRLLVARRDSEQLERVRRADRYEQILALQADDDQLLVFREASHSTLTPPQEAGLPLRFAIAGDTGVGDEWDQERLIKQMEKVHAEKPFDAFFLLGDNLYGHDPFPIAITERFVLPFSTFIRDEVPFYATLGNHDNDHPDRIESELHFPLFNMNGTDHYTETFGDDLLTLFVLNSVKLEDGEWEQRDWFARVLAESDARWKVLILHHPMVASRAASGPETLIFHGLRSLIAQPGGVDVVFAGHNHLYERQAPVDGVWHITVGASGKLEEDDPFQPDPYRLAGYMDGLSFGYMDVDREKIRFYAVSEYGDLLDEFEIRKDETPQEESERIVAHRDSMTYQFPPAFPFSP